ncbi:MAG TPA: PEGA domain-containing protein [Candidatus Angelobacter sp.]|nr:PEGA domain-containing protein [Candidatus Angelobacter sp.]
MGSVRRFAISGLLFTVPAFAIQNESPTQPLAPQVQSTAQPQSSPNNSVTPPKPAALTGFGLEDGTPVKLRLTRNLSSASDRTGDTVDFEVIEDVSMDNIVVIPRGSTAWATITEASPKKRMGRGGKLDVNIDSVRLKDGEKAALRAVREDKGGGHVGAMTGAMVATGIIFFPAAPLFLFMHGKDINIPKGTEITAYVAGNTPLTKTKFQEGALETSSAAAPSTVSALTAVSISSTPRSADIEVDGKFVGNTPSSVSLPAGDHSVKITKKGFRTWERKLAVSGGVATVNAELEEDK